MILQRVGNAQLNFTTPLIVHRLSHSNTFEPFCKYSIQSVVYRRLTHIFSFVFYFLFFILFCFILLCCVLCFCSFLFFCVFCFVFHSFVYFFVLFCVVVLFRFLFFVCFVLFHFITFRCFVLFHSQKHWNTDFPPISFFLHHNVIQFLFHYKKGPVAWKINV